MDWEGCGKKHSWPMSRYCSYKIVNQRKSSIKVVGVMAKI